MEPKARLDARISSLSEFQQIARAMRAIAAAHVQEARESLLSIRCYAVQIEEGIADAAALFSERETASPEPGVSGDSVIIAVCSEYGLTGAYSSEVLERAMEVVKGGARLAIVGRKGRLLAEERGAEIIWSLPMATHVQGASKLCLNIMERISGMSRVSVAFAQSEAAGRWTARVLSLAPLDPRLLERSDARRTPFHYLPPDALLAKLAVEYVFAELMRAVMEGFASENSARLAIMEAAENSAGEKLERLSREQKVMRQEDMTAELLDIIVGAEAVRGRQ